jgi:copper chaperone CopZ
MTMPDDEHGDLRVTLPLTGMTCGACERRVSRGLLKVPGVQDVAVSSRRGTAVITVSGDVPWAGIATAVEDAGYAVGRAPWVTRDPAVWRRALVAGAAVAVVAWLLFGVGLGQVRGSLDDPGAGGLLVVALLGLTAGVSTCAALVGGLVLAVSAQRCAGARGPAVVASAPGVPRRAHRWLLRAGRAPRRGGRAAVAARPCAGPAHRRRRRVPRPARAAPHRPLAAPGRLEPRSARALVEGHRRRRRRDRTPTRAPPFSARRPSSCRAASPRSCSSTR